MGHNKSIAYERIVPGRGDMVMLRPALVTNIEKNPDCDHILYCTFEVIPILSDIPGLELVGIPGKNVSQRHIVAQNKISDVGYDRVYVLNNCCVSYELATMPNVDKSRQELFCDAIGVTFDANKYNVRFSESELEFADNFLANLTPPFIGIHMKPAMAWREYPYMEWLINRVAKDLNGTVITVDPEYRYNGRKKNVSSLISPDIREVWATMSKMNLGIGVDSWGCHAWGSTGVDVYGIFGPTDPKIFLQYPGKMAWAPLTKLCPYKKRCWYRPCASPKDTMPTKPPRCLSVLSPPPLWQDIVCKYGIQDWLIKSKKYKPLDGDIKSEMKTLVSIVGRGDMALLMTEGLGGTTALLDVATKVYNQAKEKSVVFVRKFPELFENHPYVKDVELIGDADFEDCIDPIRKSFSLVGGVKTGTAQWFSTRYNAVGSYDPLYDNYPSGIKVLEGNGLNFIQNINRSLGLPYKRIENFTFNSEEVVGLPFNYIAISNGVDVDHRGLVQTKSWPHCHWEELAKLVDYPLVQFGTDFDKKIHGTIDFRGKTSIPQLLYALSHASAVICQEGGIMHLGHAVMQKNVFVMRGPTAGTFFRYPGHCCIDSAICVGCYWDTPVWWRDCPRKIDAICMKSIKPELVAAVANKISRQQLELSLY